MKTEPRKLNMTVREIPEDLRLAVRGKALLEGKTMQEIIILLMENYLEEDK